MARTVLTLNATPALPETGELVSTETQLDNTNGMTLVNVAKPRPMLLVRCVNNGTIRFTSTQNGDTYNYDVAMTAGQRRAFQFPSEFNRHASGADPTLLYIDQVGGAGGDFMLHAFIPYD